MDSDEIVAYGRPLRSMTTRAFVLFLFCLVLFCLLLGMPCLNFLTRKGSTEDRDRSHVPEKGRAWEEEQRGGDRYHRSCGGDLHFCYAE